jgi:hypothetical protein
LAACDRNISERLAGGRPWRTRGGISRGLLTTEPAESFDIWNAQLTKFVNKLAQQGCIETVRGKGGRIRHLAPRGKLVRSLGIALEAG